MGIFVEIVQISYNHQWRISEARSVDEEVEGEEEEEGKNNVGNEYVDREGCGCVWVFSLFVLLLLSQPRRVCFAFRETGSCSRGDNCRYWHGLYVP